MKKQISILLLFVYLFSFQEFRQVLKLPNLVQHIIKHEIKDNHFSIVEFVKHHYFSGNVMDNDYAQDMKLPFKQVDFSSFSATFIALNKTYDYELEIPKKIFFEKNTNFIYKKDFVREYHYSIFQPPEIS